ncbi:MAG: asparaginase [Rubrobacter sp.]|nr:asparaginase [Rubrobacter sp.]
MARSTHHDLPADVPLCAVRRGGLIESFHRGRYVVCGARGEVLESGGDPGGYVSLRSAAKPLQALPVVTSGAAAAFGLSARELAVVCGSHNGEDGHLSAVRSILEKAGLSERDLQSGAHPPLHAPSADRLRRSGERPRPLHGNCSGKHAGMLAVSVHEGWETGSYRSPDHPVQRLALGVVAGVCNVEPDRISLANDGCGVPAFALPLGSLAAGFARLASGRNLPGELEAAAGEVRAAMGEYPWMVAGTGRFDTQLMQETGLVAKGGAEGVLAVGSPDGWGLAIKVSDGSGRAVAPVACSLLRRRGIELPERAEDRELANLHGEVVGEMLPLVREAAGEGST